MVHNDLHLGNVFLMNKTRALFDGKAVNAYEYISYKIGNDIYYITTPDFIVKIGDLGFSQKYTYPKILLYDVIAGEYSTVPNYNTRGYYDLFLFCSQLYIGGKLIGAANRLFNYIFGKLGSTRNTIVDLSIDPSNPGRINPELYDIYDTLPKIDNTLFRRVFTNYHKKPISGSILNVGNL